MHTHYHSVYARVQLFWPNMAWLGAITALFFTRAPYRTLTAFVYLSLVDKCFFAFVRGSPKDHMIRGDVIFDCISSKS